MYYGYGIDPTVIILIPAMIFAFIAQGRVKSVFNRYSRVRNQNGLTGAQAARRVLDANGLQDVQIRAVGGSLTDNYDPRSRTLNLSEPVCNVPSVSAVSVACHEAGHAIQHARNYVPLKVRNGIVPVVNFASSASWILIIIGFGLLAAMQLVMPEDMQGSRRVLRAAAMTYVAAVAVAAANLLRLIALRNSD